MSWVIEMDGLCKTYQKPNELPVKAIDRVSLRIESHELVAILGPSGSGKSTLMNVMGLLDRPDKGDYLLDGEPVLKCSNDQLAGLRNRCLGFVFQSYHLMQRTTAIENVQLPLLYANCKDYKQRSEEALCAVSLWDRRNHYTEELSGGQQQRVAIARAIVNRPKVLLADEPTGNLDSAATREIIDLLKSLNADGVTVVLITHEVAVAREAKRVIRIRDGAIEDDFSAAQYAEVCE